MRGWPVRLEDERESSNVEDRRSVRGLGGARQVMHGKTSAIRHEGLGVFEQLPSPFLATRYHSLVIERESLPDVLEVTATSEDGEIMGVRHRTLPVQGVQFHPESILTECGHSLLANFLKTTA